MHPPQFGNCTIVTPTVAPNFSRDQAAIEAYHVALWTAVLLVRGPRLLLSSHPRASRLSLSTTALTPCLPPHRVCPPLILQAAILIASAYVLLGMDSRKDPALYVSLMDPRASAGKSQ